jgi:hypothetical protein
MRARALLLATLTGAAVVLTGCGDDTPDTAPTARVQAGNQTVEVQPTQYCLGGEGQRYQVTPPIVEVEADSTITLRVDPAVAERGWSVQVFDDQLEETIGTVDVEADTTTFTGINSSDVVPAAFYLVLVEDSVDDQCDGLSGAWPIGFVRAGGDLTAPAG